jgi:hypothetical protein
MIDRRKFVTLVSALPLFGKRMLASSVKRENKSQLPPGFVQCGVCGEFNGSTDAKNLSSGNRCRPSGRISVTCLCHGIPCPRCKTRLIHRPITNTYYPDVNEVWHWPYFAGLAGCTECRVTVRN